MMLKFMKIPSMDKLCSVIEKSRGNLFLEQAEEVFIDLKQSSSVSIELQNILKQGDNIKLHVVDAKDYLELVNFMVGTVYDESACI